MSKKCLASTWLVFVGASLSAFWILVANAWMQYPIGMEFNFESVRNEMVDFWAVAFSPVAYNKFLHTTFSCWAVGAAFVVAISGWYLLKEAYRFCSEEHGGSLVGLVAFVMLAVTGDGSAYHVAQKQPMKLAAMGASTKVKRVPAWWLWGCKPHTENYNDGVDPLSSR